MSAKVVERSVLHAAGEGVPLALGEVQAGAGRDGAIQESAYGAVWQAARTAVFTVAQQASPLARRAYDLRHATVSLWLNAGVPATEVARRAGHSVAVLLKVYAHCIDGQADAANQRITDALTTPDNKQS